MNGGGDAPQLGAVLLFEAQLDGPRVQACSAVCRAATNERLVEGDGHVSDVFLRRQPKARVGVVQDFANILKDDGSWALSVGENRRADFDGLRWTVSDGLGVQRGAEASRSHRKQNEEHEHQMHDEENRGELSHRLAQRELCAVAMEDLVEHEGVARRGESAFEDRDGEVGVLGAVKVVVVKDVRVRDDDEARRGAYDDGAFGSVEEDLVIATDGGEDLQVWELDEEGPQDAAELSRGVSFGEPELGAGEGYVSDEARADGVFADGGDVVLGEVKEPLGQDDDGR